MSTTVLENKGVARTETQQGVQKFGRFLSGMVMPNIGAFIAWGLITAFFIPTGWTPNENLAQLVGPMIVYLLPLLIGYTGGKSIAGVRGGVIGAVATMGVIVGADIPMILGSMIMGPLGGYMIKKADEGMSGKVPAGFEMLVNNFSAGIVGMLLAVLGFLGIGPVVLILNDALRAGVEVLVNQGLFPLTSVFIEPAKILFLNNAINHGVLGPMGIQQATETGQSIFFLLETNPGPGMGILLAYWVFSKGMVRQSAPGAVIIHFLGGIHEIYFPYVLMKPVLLLAVIAGGASGVFTFNLLNAGLVATPSPGSFVALMAMTPRGGFVPVVLGVLVSTAVSFLVASVFVKGSAEKDGMEELEQAKGAMKELKGKKQEQATPAPSETAKALKVQSIIFACDAGMGSSAMGATTLRNKLKREGLPISVVHKAVDEIPADAQLVVTHESLTARARGKVPDAEHISITNFMDAKQYDSLIERLKK
ncbi:PTS mannitol transporter subunit IICB [Anaerotalea alkaliphila]|uniref:PTS system mannitol-specific EIICB component n=1 Tax=Anaerotalea alkaliphila TaxID=2662126 RepID=A0A7X5HUR2_9FIRM|nr:PTS mannitol transporter subunit IICBA [Anaerotalea alkaliphila]NDL66990.1 PTS mannitol transporter subunit IICBA [Anaerotalea alkaliphila]